ncbi:hypothetical protein [Aurantiacibacter spongiae]|nr:hypothetical protein [Aurantiacibacter spongiae]
MSIIRREQQDEVEGPGDTFTGKAIIRGMFERDDPSCVTVQKPTANPGT